MAPLAPFSPQNEQLYNQHIKIVYMATIKATFGRFLPGPRLCAEKLV
jgi:hypothetical protein